MAQVCYDIFQKPDGAVGAEYTVYSGSYDYYSNSLRAVTQGWLRPTVSGVMRNSCQFATIYAPTAFPKVPAMRFRQTADESDAIVVEFYCNTTYVRCDIRERLSGANTTIASRVFYLTYGDTVDISASCFNEQVVAWVNGFQVLSCRQDSVTAAGYSTMYLPTTSPRATYWATYEYGEDGYSVSVDSGPDENGDYTLTLKNAGLEWTAGTPGSPTFVAQSGLIQSQEVTDEDTAVVVWRPTALWAEELIIDPLNDYSIPFGVSSPPGETGPGGGGGALTPTQSGILDDMATYLAAYNTQTSQYATFWLQAGAFSLLMASGYTEGDGSAAGDLLDAVLGQETGLAVLKNRVDLIRAAQDALDGTGTYSLSSVQEAIRGTSSRDLTAVYNLIDALEVADPTDVTSILNAIAAIRTANMWSLDSVKTWIEAIPAASNQDVLNELALIRTANNWSLGHVMDAIDAITVPDYGDQLDTIDTHVLAIPTNPITSLQPALDAVAGVRGSGNPDLAAILSAVNAIPTNPITDLSSVISAISTLSGHLDDKIELVLAAIAAIVPGQGTPTAPVWPGIGNVTLGNPINLGLTFAYAGPCDGVIVSISADPLARGLYDWGGETQHPRAGYLSFVSDNGDYTDPSPFTFASHLLTPIHMTHADGFIGRARSGVAGTVTPWTINVA